MKTAVVTGAAQGLGLVTARRLATAGFRVVLTDVQDVTAQAETLGTDALAISGDISDERFVEDLAARIAVVSTAAHVGWRPAHSRPEGLPKLLLGLLLLAAGLVLLRGRRRIAT